MGMNKILKMIQGELVAPKGQFNNFGKYNYRSCEDILEALKPLLKKHNTTLTLTDEIVNTGNRFYVRARADIQNEEGSVAVFAFAREAETKKGMDEAQITGAASSYARKFALSGLFCIDDTKDIDSGQHNGNGYIDEKQKAKIVAGVAEKGLDTEKFLSAFNITGIEKLPKKRFEEAMDAIKKAKGAL